MAVVPPLAVEQLPDGVYIGLPEAIYFAQDRLGSSDLKTLHFEREGWWWQSRHNPDKPSEQTAAQNYGSALHTVMLEGVPEYRDRFAVSPDWRAYPNLITSQKQLREVLNDNGWVAEKGISAWTPQQWWDAIELHAPGWRVKDQVEAEFRRSIATKTAADGTVLETKPTVTAVEDRMLMIMHDAATNEDRDDNVEVRQLLGVGTGHPTLAEVSVLFTCPWTGVKRRARWDKPVPWHTIDLKSLANWRGSNLFFDLDPHIKRNGYDIQVGDQHVSRVLAYRMLADRGERALHGGTKDERAWMLAMATRALPWDWAWLFYQKPDPSGKAPVLFPLRAAWGGVYHESGHRRAFRAIHLYRDLVAKHGLEKPWSRIERLHYSDEFQADEHMTDGKPAPRIFLGHGGWDENPVDGEDDLLHRRELPDTPAPGASASIV